MGKVNSYKDLLVWQKAMVVETEVYASSRSFPLSETYGLISQIRSCEVSIPSITASGYGRHSTADSKRFLQIAVGSLFELQTQVEIAYNFRYITNDIFEAFFGKTKELDRMLFH